jgi:hypothetical protein
VVYGARLESVCRGNSTVGSNPTLSAKLCLLDSITYRRLWRSRCNEVLQPLSCAPKIAAATAKHADLLP